MTKLAGYTIGFDKEYETILESAGGLPARLIQLEQMYGLIKIYKRLSEAKDALKESIWAKSIYEVYLHGDFSGVKIFKLKEEQNGNNTTE